MTLEWKRLESGEPPSVTYVIATNPRTGSWLLADALNATRVAGKPGEWFSWLEEQKIRKALPGMDYAKYVKFACSQSCTSNGVSAVKMHRHDFDVLAGKLSGDPGMQAVGDVLKDAKFIWLTRQDKARQAISYVLARATHDWWQVKGAKPRWKRVEYDRYAIAQAEQELTYLDECWEGWFTRNNIEPLALTYEEDLEFDYRHATRRVLDWLGVQFPAEIPVTRLVRQSDARNEEWLARYLEGK